MHNTVKEFRKSRIGKDPYDRRITLLGMQEGKDDEQAAMKCQT